jgi:hypothetical protein
MNNVIGDDDIMALLVVTGDRTFGCLWGLGFRESNLESERRLDLHHRSQQHFDFPMR